MDLLRQTPLLAVLIFGCDQAVAQKPRVTIESLKVRVELTSKTYRVGDSPTLKVTLTNVGSTPFLVPNKLGFFGDEEGDLSVHVVELHGRRVIGVGMAADCAGTNQTKLEVEDVLQRYLLLLPGKSYVQNISLGLVHPNLQPGAYRMKASYSACFCLISCTQWDPADVEKFPISVWTGETSTNEVSFRVLGTRLPRKG